MMMMMMMMILDLGEVEESRSRRTCRRSGDGSGLRPWWVRVVSVVHVVVHVVAAAAEPVLQLLVLVQHPRLGRLVTANITGISDPLVL